MEREQARLQRALDDTLKEIEKMEVRRQEFEAIKHTLSEAQRQRQGDMASRIIVGQLELDAEAAAARVQRLRNDIARQQDYMKLWEAIDQSWTRFTCSRLHHSTHTPTPVVWVSFREAHLLRFYAAGQAVHDEAGSRRGSAGSKSACGRLIRSGDARYTSSGQDRFDPDDHPRPSGSSPRSMMPLLGTWILPNE